MRPVHLIRPAALVCLVCSLAVSCEQKPVSIAPESEPGSWKTVLEPTRITYDDVSEIFGFPDGSVFFGNRDGTVSRYDRNGWTDPFARLDDQVLDIWGASSQDFYVLTWPTLHHFSGGGWSEIRPGGRALWGAPDNQLFLADNYAIRRFDGSGWGVIDSTLYRYVNGIWGTSSSDVFFACPGGLLHFDGDSVRVLTDDQSVSCFDVWGSSATDVYAVGSDGHVFHYNGTAPVSVSRITASTLYRIWGSGPDDIYAITRDDVLHYDGIQWDVVDLRDYQVYSSVWGSRPDEFYFGGEHNRVLMYDGHSARMIRGEQPAVVSAAWADPATGDLVASEGRRLFRYDGGRWREMPANGRSTVRFLWGDSVTRLYAAGCPRVTRFDGAGWSTEFSLPFSPSAVWFYNDSCVYLGGPDVLRSDGTSWQTVFDGDLYVRAIHGSSPDNVYCVGSDESGGFVLRFNGRIWEYIVQGYAAWFYGVWVVSETEVYAGGAFKGILRFNGSKWNFEPMAPEMRSFQILWGTARTDLYAAGVDYIAHFDGSVWSEEYERGGHRFTHLVGSPAGPVYAVVNYLEILKREGR